MNRLSKISQSFSHAVLTYDHHALIQKFAARRLAFKILTTPTLGNVLEIGCGTGILSEHLVSHANLYVLTDISLPLLRQAEKKVNSPQVVPLVVDGEQPCFSACFDLIVSNLALHWFSDPKAALTRLTSCLKPGGKLYLTTFGNNTFHEWRTAHSLVEAPCGALDFITFGQLKTWLPLSGACQIEEEWITTTPENSLAFLRDLKAMGAHVAHPGYKPLPYKTFKAVRDIYDQNPQTSYQILYATYQHPEKVREE